MKEPKILLVKEHYLVKFGAVKLDGKFYPDLNFDIYIASNNNEEWYGRAYAHGEEFVSVPWLKLRENESMYPVDEMIKIIQETFEN
ncbi:hypothetical protein 10F3_36 [uncultured Caudovirales phage]|uniref:Uncharacterized protein n=1 Tax=uncultured Caudovirales phage TaxID=2100421 RepID=A0A2H4JDN6_9CAUD|nr:hypothetical protein 10F3_36 [uncultured Caudovirales phage]